MLEIKDDSDRSLVNSLQKWAETEVVSKRLEYQEDYYELIYPAMQKLMIDIEMQKILWPEDKGGAEYNTSELAVTLAHALEQVGWADVGIAFVSSATYALCSTFALEKNSREKLVEKIAPLFCDTEDPVIGSLILPEYGGSDSDSGALFGGKYLQARARKEGKNWLIDGENMRPLNSGVDASLYGVFCNLEGEDSPGFFIVPADSPGIKKGDLSIKTGLGASRNCSLQMEKVKVADDNLVFKGRSPYLQMMSWLYLGASATATGAHVAAYEIVKDWGDSRVIKGKGQVFKNNPLTASLMAEISQEMLLNRLLTSRLAQMLMEATMKDDEEVEQIYVSSLSIVNRVTHAAEKSLNHIMELMGSAGYATEWNLERYWRDLKTMQVHLGNWEIHKMDLASYFYK